MSHKHTHVQYRSQTSTAKSVGIVHTPNVCVSVMWLQSPGYGRHTPSVFVNKVAASVEDPTVVEGHEGVSGCGGRVLSILPVSVLQRGELVLPQHLVHYKGPGENTQRQTGDFIAMEMVDERLMVYLNSKSMIPVADLASRRMRVY